MEPRGCAGSERESKSQVAALRTLTSSGSTRRYKKDTPDSVCVRDWIFLLQATKVSCPACACLPARNGLEVEFFGLIPQKW